ncbi:cation:proton antiporter [Candidatus Bathyarchaeota archaeon]|nr:MAG: cation:proton antiporter [Candidatus Hecatellales archaeon]RLI34625.1 MAG: cation:proton antiporter [Candidatus Bathyarchaeota archaeon]
MVIALYCIFYKRNLIKIILGLMILSDGINLLFILIGYKFKGVPPILHEEAFKHGLEAFYAAAVDPLPQAFVLTAIVISMSVTAAALALTIKIYQKYGTLDVYKIRRVRE